MARDSQAALVALNRFGFGARGGASGDFVNAASDPRGFVKAEMSRPNGVLLEVPGLAVDRGARQGGVRLSVRDPAGARRGCQITAPSPPRPRDRNRLPMRKGNGETCRSTASPWTWRRRSRRRSRRKATRRCVLRQRLPETMQPAAPKPPPQPLNIIQKTFRAEALARLQRAIIADCGFTERLVVFWSNHFCISANKGGVARMWAGSFEREAIRPLRARALRRHAEGGRAASGDAVLSRQPAIAGAGFARREKPQPRPERKSRARNPGAAYARRRRRLFAGRRDLAGAHHHRVDLCRTAGPARRARHLRLQRQCAPARRACA